MTQATFHFLSAAPRRHTPFFVAWVFTLFVGWIVLHVLSLQVERLNVYVGRAFFLVAIVWWAHVAFMYVVAHVRRQVLQEIEESRSKGSSPSMN
jgi:hypothetical protein